MRTDLHPVAKRPPKHPGLDALIQYVSGHYVFESEYIWKNPQATIVWRFQRNVGLARSHFASLDAAKPFQAQREIPTLLGVQRLDLLLEALQDARAFQLHGRSEQAVFRREFLRS